MTASAVAAAASSLDSSAIPTDLFIGGNWVPAHEGRRFDVDNPADRSFLASVPDAGLEDAKASLAAAVRAQPAWAATPPTVRSEILTHAYGLLLEEAETLATLITLEMGKPLADARGEVKYASEFLRWFAAEAMRIDGGHTVSGDGKTRIIVSREPVGPCVLVTPWNFPLAMGARKIGPALAAGCTVLFKPAEQTPLTALYLVDILHRAGVPAGVVNVVTTQDPAAVVGHWLDSGQARKISFTGSTAVGKILLEQAGRNVMRTSMELGGNAPFVVFNDADVDSAVEGALIAKMRNMGEACTAANRFYVHEDVAEEFTTLFAARMSALRVLPGMEPGSEVGPLIDEAGRDKVAFLVEDALAKGARLVTGGVPTGDDLFFPPTVLTEVPQDAALYATEIFGPVAPIVTFGTDEEVVERANGTSSGLVGYIYTKDITRAFSIAAKLEVGMVGLNTGLVSNPLAPFGGVKDSGLGREGGKIGIDEFLEYKYIAMPLT